MDRFPNLESDIESDPDVLDLDTDYDIPLTDDDDSPSKNVDHKNIGKHWRDIVNGEQMEGGLTRLEVTNKTPGYTDMDDPNYQPTTIQNRKRSFSSMKSNQKSTNLKIDNQSDFKSNYGAKKKYLHTNKNFPKCSDVDDKRVTIRSRILPLLKESEEMADNELLNYLCTNLHEPNMILMSSMISKIDRKTIIDKYNSTVSIELNGGQMIKNGNRRRTSGGIFFSLLKDDQSIPNTLKKDLYGSSLSEQEKKEKKKRKMKRKKEKLKEQIALDKMKKAEMLEKELETLPNTLMENEKSTVQ